MCTSSRIDYDKVEKRHGSLKTDKKREEMYSGRNDLQVMF